MAQYLYIPLKKNTVPLNQQADIKQWVEIEAAKGVSVNVCYLGDEGLKDLPHYAKIIVLFYGKPGPRSPLWSTLPREVALSFISTSAHLRLELPKEPVPALVRRKDDDEMAHVIPKKTAKPISVYIPEIANQMIKDGLGAGKSKRIDIKLVFCDMQHPVPEQKTSFIDALKTHAIYKEKQIRIDSYFKTSQPVTATKRLQHSPKFKTNPVIDQFIEQVNEPNKAIFSNDVCAPGLSMEQVAEVRDHYRHYKSARLCGLSGILGLNGFFSSTASTDVLKYLQDGRNSDAARFSCAARYVRHFPNHYLSQCLQPIVAAARNENNLSWNRLA